LNIKKKKKSKKFSFRTEKFISSNKKFASKEFYDLEGEDFKNFNNIGDFVTISLTKSSSNAMLNNIDVDSAFE
jgi:hypothetical protein